MRTLTILLILFVSACVLWGLMLLVSTPAMSRSIHEMGQRVGKVLPQGHDTDSQLPQSQMVRVGLPAHGIVLSHPERPPASLRAKLSERPKFTHMMSNGIDLLLVTLIIIGSIGFALISMLRLQRWSNETRQIERSVLYRRMIRACLFMVPIGLMIGPMFVIARNFWTGVDDAFIERSVLIRPSSQSVHVLGDTTLAMNFSALMMLYLAVLITALPIMFIVAVYLTGNIGGLRTRWSQSRLTAPARGLLSLPAVQSRFNTQSMTSVAVICYLLLTVVLWCAPWSTTIARAMWSF